MGSVTLEHRVNVLKAIASVPRLRILEALSDSDLCVSELTGAVGGDISTVSRHLNVLRNAGIVSSSRRGSHVLYHLLTPCVLSFFNCVDNVVRGSGQKDREMSP